MRVQMKYITFNDHNGVPSLVTSSGNIPHSLMVEKMGLREVRSAGFITLTHAGFHCHGQSESLGVASLVSDSKIANAYFKQ